jgi:hypothetical protein
MPGLDSIRRRGMLRGVTIRLARLQPDSLSYPLSPRTSR